MNTNTNTNVNKQFPIVFISYDEPNADENWGVLQRQATSQNLQVVRSHGVKGFDAAHKAARDRALELDPDTTHFFTVDGDTVVFSDTWAQDFRHSLALRGPDPDVTYSWRSINNVNGLAYGNGGLKLWSVNFVNQMVTHEAAQASHAAQVSAVAGLNPAPVVDFCWDSNYIQMAAILGVTKIDGSNYQAWRAGFREGVKMLLQNGKPLRRYETEINVNTNTNLKRFLQWTCLGEDFSVGEYAIHGALAGFVYAHLEEQPIDVVMDYEEMKLQFQRHFPTVPAPETNVYPYSTTGVDLTLGIQSKIQHLRTLVSQALGTPLPRVGPVQSRTIKLFLTPHKQSINETETWQWLHQTQI